MQDKRAKAEAALPDNLREAFNTIVDDYKTWFAQDGASKQLRHSHWKNAGNVVQVRGREPPAQHADNVCANAPKWLCSFP